MRIVIRIKHFLFVNKARFNTFLDAVAWGYKMGARFYRDSHYRNQTKKNIRTKMVYGAFLGNKESLRDAIVIRDGPYCNWCSKDLEVREMTVDHVVPLSDGGTNKKTNLQILCHECHLLKTMQDRDELDNDKSEWVHLPFAEAFKKLKHATQTTNKP